MDKPAIRADMRALREALGVRPVLAVPAAFRALLAPGMIVASYMPVRGEADPAPLAQAAADAGCTIALPHVVDRATPLRFLAWEAELVAGPFGLRQPLDHAGELAPDLILTPLVAFDRALGRIGQGAGHYDRAFVRFPDARRIGVALSLQEVPHVPTDPWDVPLHVIITEKEWITP